MGRYSALLLFFLGILWTIPGSAQIRLFVSVIPLKHFAERVGGSHVVVESLVQPGHSPATYEPSTRQMAALASANAFVRVGVPFETVWLERIRSTHPDLTIIDARDGVDLMPAGDHLPASESPEGKSKVHDHNGSDPHIWLDPAIAKKISENLRDYLMRTDPRNAGIYEDNTERFAAELTELDLKVRALVEQGENRQFLVFHPAWGYFARAYGLEQLTVEHEGKAPGPRSLARLIELGEREGIRTVFVQPQFNARTAETLAVEMGADVAVLDPLAEDYAGNLLYAARAISGISRP